jgi:hypothetical protein
MIAVVYLVVIGPIGLPAVPAGATSFNPYTYNVEGQLSIFGNDVCTPSPCTETLDFSFHFQWVESGAGGIFQIYIPPGTATITASGPLGDQWRTVQGLFYSPYYFPMADQYGNEIDLDMPNLTFSETPWIGPTFFGAELYACQTAACVDAFVDPIYSDRQPPYYGIYLGGTVQYTTERLDAVPEEGTLGLLSLCLMGIALWQWKQRGRVLA